MATIGRNESCPCGSGKKYKKCCLAAGEAQVDYAQYRKRIDQEYRSLPVTAGQSKRGQYKRPLAWVGWNVWQFQELVDTLGRYFQGFKKILSVERTRVPQATEIKLSEGSVWARQSDQVTPELRDRLDRGSPEHIARLLTLPGTGTVTILFESTEPGARFLILPLEVVPTTAIR
jgi:hypothetical protein